MAPSPVWVYFNKNGNGTNKVVKCAISSCSKEYTNPATSTLYYHLSHNHFIHLRKNPANQKKRVKNNHVDDDTDPDDVEAVDGNASHGEQDQSEQGAATSLPSTSGHVAVDGVEGPLDRCLNSALAFSRGGYRDKICTDSLLYMMSKMNLALRTPEDEAFRTFCQKLQPLYHVPCEQTCTKRMIEIYERLRNVFKKKISAADFVYLTVDLWTDSHTMQGYLGVSAHFREGTEVTCVEIGAKPMPKRKTTENLQSALAQICKEWGIGCDRVRAVVSDGGANIKAAVRAEFGAEKHVSCFAHLLNAVGQAVLDLSETPCPSEEENVVHVPEDEEEAINAFEDLPEEPAAPDSDVPTSFRALITKVKRTVRWFRSSEVATQELKSLQIENGKAEHETLKMIQEVRTRWNSAYYMIDRYLLLSDLVNRVILKMQRDRSTKSRPPQILNMDETEVLTEARDLLKPLEEATRIMSKEKEVTGSLCIPILFGMKEDVMKVLPITPLGFNIKHKLLRELDRRFAGYEFYRVQAAATLLDPRFKKAVFSDPMAVRRVVSYLNSRITENLSHESEVGERNPETEKTSSGIWGAIDSRIRDKSSSVAEQQQQDGTRTVPMAPQLTAYLQSAVVDRETNPNPLAVWMKLRHGLEQVFKLAMEFLCFPATSTSAERLFSHAGAIACQLRSRMSPDNVDRRVFLRSVPKKYWFNN